MVTFWHSVSPFLYCFRASLKARFTLVTGRQLLVLLKQPSLTKGKARRGRCRGMSQGKVGAHLKAIHYPSRLCTELHCKLAVQLLFSSLGPVVIRPHLVSSTMADAASQDFMGRVIGAASQGAVGAVVAASLSAVTEPLVNNMLVNRATLGQAIKELDPNNIRKYLNTTLSTNFIKFPFFEATNIIMQGVDLPPTARGAALGSVFCTITLPITNYRFRKSMNMPVTASNLYQAYPPTVLRDIIYGIARNKVSAFLILSEPCVRELYDGPRSQHVHHGRRSLRAVGSRE